MEELKVLANVQAGVITFNSEELKKEVERKCEKIL